MKTVYCIGFEDQGRFVADWYEYEDVRDKDKLSTGAEKEIYFEVAVPPESSSEQITAMADDLSWFKFTYPRKEDQSIEVVVA